MEKIRVTVERKSKTGKVLETYEKEAIRMPANGPASAMLMANGIKSIMEYKQCQEVDQEKTLNPKENIMKLPQY